MKKPLLHTCTLLLAVINALAGITLLLLSGWFLAACALAGLSTAALTFNYVVPAAIIRQLALSRIAAGYGEKAVGHHSLLEKLHQLRLSWFGRLLYQQQTPQLRAEQAERLNQSVEDRANAWLSVIHPHLANLAILGAATLMLWHWTPAALPLWAGIVILNLLLLGVLSRAYRGLELQREQSQQQLRSGWEHWLNTATLWLLSPRFGQGEQLTPLNQSWLRCQLRQRRLESSAEALVILGSGAAILALLWTLPQTTYGSALLMLPVILLLAMPDWFGNSIRAIRPAIAAIRAQQQLQTHEVDPKQESHTAQPSLMAPYQLILEQFSWRYDTAVKVDKQLCAQWNSGELIWLQGSSGVGKSSLLLALVGEIEQRGEVSLNAQSFTCWSHKTRQQYLHYVDQFPYVLSASLRENLQLAAPEATESQLLEALSFAGLDHLHEALEQWVGESGRQLSGGEIKRLGLARAWLRDAPIWLLDEPFEGLDHAMQLLLAQRLQTLANEKLIVVASHLWPDSITVNQTLTLD